MKLLFTHFTGFSTRSKCSAPSELIHAMTIHKFSSRESSPGTSGTPPPPRPRRPLCLPVKCQQAPRGVLNEA